MLTSAIVYLTLLFQASPVPEAGLPPHLRLEARLVKQSRCRQPGSGELELDLNLLLKFTNTGQMPIILYRRPDRLSSAGYSRSVADALAGQFEDRVMVDYLDVPLHLLSGKEPLPVQDYFVTLNPGESYYISRGAGFRYCIPAREHCPALIGEHYLTATFYTWNSGLGAAYRLRRLWLPFGYLWDEGLLLEPGRSIKMGSLPRAAYR